jgi:alpha-glucosidase
MRSHEGNRPDDNPQYDSRRPARLLRTVEPGARPSGPYVRHLCDEALATACLAQRPLFLHHADPALHAIQDQFLYGADLLVAPVIEEGATSRTVTLPGEKPWRHVWTGGLCARHA